MNHDVAPPFVWPDDTQEIEEGPRALFLDIHRSQVITGAIRRDNPPTPCACTHV